jgi:hypothetical protein
MIESSSARLIQPQQQRANAATTTETTAAVVAVVASSEQHLRIAMRVVGTPMLIMVVVMSFDRFVAHGRLGFVWWPTHYEEHGNTTMEFEGMIVVIYFALGVFLWLASFDPVVDHGRWLVYYTIYGACFGHAAIMAIEALWDFEQEFWHLMPWGDVSGLLLLGSALWYCQRRYDQDAAVHKRRQ